MIIPQNLRPYLVLLTSVIGQMFSPGPALIVALGAVAPLMIAALGWSRGQLMLGVTMFSVASLLSAPLIGAAIDRWGARGILISSLIGYIGGFLYLAFAIETLFGFYALLFVMGFVTMGAQPITYAALLVAWFDNRKGMALGVAATGLGVGYMTAPLIASAATAHAGWQQVFVAMAAIIAAGPLLLSLLFGHDRPVSTSKPQIGGVSIRQVAADPVFWMIGGAILLMAMVLVGVLTNIVLFARDMQFSAASAAMTAAVFGILTVAGRATAGALTDKYRVRMVAAAYFILSLAGFILIATASTLHAPALFVVAVGLIGLGFGAEGDLIGIFVIRYFGVNSFGRLYGILYSIYLLGTSCGPALMGFGRDMLGAYTPIMWAAAGLTTVAISLLFLLPDRDLLAVPEVRQPGA
jgi:MFS family permease